MQSVEFMIEEREKEFLTFIEDKIISSIQIHCQWKLHDDLLNIIIQKEKDKLKKEFEDYICERIRKIAPIHYRNMNCSPLNSLYNDGDQKRCCRVNQFNHEQERKKGICFWPTITYYEFEEEGFSRDFVKRVCKKYVDLGFLKQKKGTHGNQYSFDDIDCIIKKMSFLKKSVVNGVNGYEYDESEDFIYEQFPDEYIESCFEKIKNDTYEDMLKVQKKT